MSITPEHIWTVSKGIFGVVGVRLAFSGDLAELVEKANLESVELIVPSTWPRTFKVYSLGEAPAAAGLSHLVRLNSLLVMASGVYDSPKAVLDKLVAGLDSLIFSGMDARDAEDFFERAGKTEVASFEQLAAEHPAPVDVVNALRNAYQGSLNIYKDRKARGIRS